MDCPSAGRLVLVVCDTDPELGGSEEPWEALEDGKVEDVDEDEGEEGAELGGKEVNEFCELEVKVGGAGGSAVSVTICVWVTTCVVDLGQDKQNS